MLAIPIGLLALAVVPEPEIRSEPAASKSEKSSVIRVFRETPILFVIYGLMFFANVLLYAIVIFLPQLLETFGTSSTFRIGLFLTAMTGSAGATAFIYGWIRSHLTYRSIVAVAVLLWAVAFTTISRAAAGPIIAAAVALFGVSHGLILPTVMVWIGNAVPLSFRGRFSSYLGTSGFIGQFLSPILFAPVMIAAGIRGVFMVGAGIGAFWFLLLLLSSKKGQ